MAQQITAIIKTTHACNLACNYCFASDNQGSMLNETLIALLKRLAEYAGDGGRAKCVWHGGEPLLMPMAFYRKALEIQRCFPRVTFTNGVQTNGTLLTDSFVEFAADNHWGIGISLDGPARFHDAHRLTCDGKATWSQVHSAMERYGKYLAQPGRPRLGVICSVTEALSDHPLETYEVFREHPVALKIHPVLSATDGVTPSPERYGSFLQAFLSAWLKDTDAALLVSTFDEIICSVAGFTPRECTWASSCHAEILAVDTNGDVYPCDRAVGMRPLHLGSLIEKPLSVILEGQVSCHFRNRTPRECEECSDWTTCHGGCAMHALESGLGPASPDPFCGAYRMIFQWARDVLEQDIMAKSTSTIEATNG